jgi:hypothetical protein
MPAGGEDIDAAKRAQIIVAATVVAPVPPRDQAGGEIGARQFRHALRLAEPVELRVGQPDMDAPADHRDGGRRGAGGAHLGLDPGGGLHVLGKGHAMGDDGRFQRDQRRTGRRASATSGEKARGGTGGGTRAGRIMRRYLRRHRPRRRQGCGKRRGPVVPPPFGHQMRSHESIARAGDAGDQNLRRRGGDHARTLPAAAAARPPSVTSTRAAPRASSASAASAAQVAPASGQQIRPLRG